MSNPILDHENAESPVSFGVLWKALAILAFAMLSFTTLSCITWGYWVTTTLGNHETRLAVLFERSGSGKGVSQSVNVGAVDDVAGLVQDSAKTWLTTKDVAAREGVTERTVINYIQKGMIEPAPVLNGKSWEIAEHFRIVPNDSEFCGPPEP